MLHPYAGTEFPSERGRRMDIGVILTLLFGGLGLAFGGYEMHADYPLIAVLSYVVGAGCVGAAVDLAVRVGNRRAAASSTGLSSAKRGKEQLPAAVAPSVPIVAEPERDRSLIDVSPFEIVRLFDEHLTPQAQTLLEPYIGKRLRLTIKVSDARIYGSGPEMFYSVHGTIPSPTDPNWVGVHVHLYFDANWKDRVLMLKRDKSITAIGEISEAGSRSITLQHCELVDQNV